ncbi:alpha/beta fold hydrolase [Rhizobium sp. C4]|uniref:alpha/beta fold hydrolase n=1 Tax=Rhizobium sp. C4 TaxID=1349800 RepID=UPI001E2B07DD|nr:alpha/beta hydrolase [Rhizobium sp. C4]MCD2174109.1 alpha/beta hydrolase [Rhizobium sp. C4]
MLKALLALLVLVPLVALAGGFVFTEWKTSQFETVYPNMGTRTDVGGYFLNSVDVPPGPNADLPPIVFIHGASGNLRDQYFAFEKPLEGRGRLIFVDRPGYGYSDRGGPENDTPAGQADAIARLLEKKGIDRAIIVGHSLGGAIAASFGVRHPDKTIGLLFLSAATHSWNGGVDWYYDLAATPVIGTVFRYSLLLSVGLGRIESGSQAVFAPNPMPPRYVAETMPGMILRPGAFYANAVDVSGLNSFVKTMEQHYREIAAPTVIITGDSDDIVAEEIHSVGLKRDIANSELLWLKGVGHKTDYVANGLAVAAIERLAGKPRDLQAMASEFHAPQSQQAASAK